MFNLQKYGTGKSVVVNSFLFAQNVELLPKTPIQTSVIMNAKFSLMAQRAAAFGPARFTRTTLAVV